MSARRGKRVAWATTACWLVVLLATGVSLRDRAVEQWHLWKLDSRSWTVRFQAASRLGELRSKRAIPKLLALLKETPGPDEEAREVWGPKANAGFCLADVLGKIGPAAVPALAEALDTTAGQRGLYWRRSACRALAATAAPEAVPALVDRLDDADTCVRLFAIRELGSMGPQAKEAVPTLAAMVNTKGVWRSAAADALEKILEAEAVLP